MKVAVVGATGMVGRKMIEILEERKFPISKFIPVASEKSLGTNVLYKNKEYKTISLYDLIDMDVDIALFSAGGSTSLEWAEQLSKKGCYVIDNSSAWRMAENIKLVVPEINGSSLTSEDRIIANPNCSTIQLVMVLAPLHKQYKIKRIIVSTYQSVSGSGKKAVDQMKAERNGLDADKAYPYPIDMNCIPQCDDFTVNGYTKEELKLVNEPKKILNDQELMITATAVRVPVSGGHSESVNIEFVNDYVLNDVKKLLKKMPGLTVLDNPNESIYPMPLMAHDKDDVYVGRLRRDYSNPKTLNMWIVADNLRKGAATNAIQIAEYLYEHDLIKK